jgi:hypothetical protein
VADSGGNLHEPSFFPASRGYTSKTDATFPQGDITDPGQTLMKKKDKMLKKKSRKKAVR